MVLLERPMSTRLTLLEGSEGFAINLNFDGVSRPDGSVDMESRAEPTASERSRDVVLRGVKGTVNLVRFSSDVFHNVDFTTSRPSSSGDIVSKSPEGRPDALSVGKLGSHLNLSVGEAELALSLEAS